MEPNIDVTEVERAAQAKLEERAAAIRALATAQQDRRDARQGLAALERTDATAYRRARDLGWSDDDLAEFGFEKPAKHAVERKPLTPSKKGTRGSRPSKYAVRQQPADAPLDIQPPAVENVRLAG